MGDRGGDEVRRGVNAADENAVGGELFSEDDVERRTGCNCGERRGVEFVMRERGNLDEEVEWGIGNCDGIDMDDERDLLGGDVTADEGAVIRSARGWEEDKPEC